MTGSLAAVSTSDPATTAAAAADQGHARAGILMGTSTGQTGASTIAVTAIPSWLTSRGTMWVAVQRIPDQEPLSAPVTISNTQVAVSGGTISIPVNRLSGTDAYSVILTPQRQDPPGADQPTLIDGPQFAFAGTWGQANGIADMFNGTANWSTTPGSTATLTFTGTRVALHAVKDFDQGIAAVRVDNAAETSVDDYAATRNASGVVWTSPTLASGTHTLTVRVTGNRNAASAGTVVAIDYAEITN